MRTCKKKTLLILKSEKNDAYSNLKLPWRVWFASSTSSLLLVTSETVLSVNKQTNKQTEVNCKFGKTCHLKEGHDFTVDSCWSPE